MAAARVQVIVHHVRARNVVGDHRQAAAAIRVGLAFNVDAMGERLGPGRFGIDRLRRRGYLNGLRQPCQLQLHADGDDRVRGDLDVLLLILEALQARRDHVVTDWHRGKHGVTLRIGRGHLRPGGRFGFQDDGRARQRQVLRVKKVDTDCSEHLGVPWIRDAEKGGNKKRGGSNAERQMGLLCRQPDSATNPSDLDGEVHLKSS